MRSVVAMILLSLGTARSTASDFSGLWLRCMTEWQAPDNFMLVEVKKERDHYNWVAEWGVPYSASGTAKLMVTTSLVGRACAHYRGEPDVNCNPNKPQVIFSIPKIATLQASSRNPRKGAWVRTYPEHWQALAKTCAASQRKNSE